MAYAGTAMEPAFTDMMFPRASEPAASMLGWPSFDETFERVLMGLKPGPWLMGETFSAADVQVGSFLGWLAGWGKLPGPERFALYLEAIAARPAHRRAFGRD